MKRHGRRPVRALALYDWNFLSCREAEEPFLFHFEYARESVAIRIMVERIRRAGTVKTTRVLPARDGFQHIRLAGVVAGSSLPGDTGKGTTAPVEILSRSAFRRVAGTQARSGVDLVYTIKWVSTYCVYTDMSRTFKLLAHVKS